MIAGGRKPKELTFYQWLITILGNVKTGLGGVCGVFLIIRILYALANHDYAYIRRCISSADKTGRRQSTASLMKITDQPTDIVCATDGNFPPHCVAMLQSLWESNITRDLRIYLNTDNADQKDLGIRLSHLHRLLRRSEAAVIVNCPDRAQFTGSRSLKQAAPESIWLFQESLILMSVLRSSRLPSCICRTAMEARMTTDSV